MELKDFVKKSILQIADGVSEAIAEQSDYGLVVNPTDESTVVKFSTLVTVEKSGSAGLKVMSAGMDSTACQRLEFSVGMKLQSGNPKVDKKPLRKIPGE